MKHIIIPPSDRNERLSQLLLREGVYVSSPCGGRGVCGKCRVRVKRGVFLSCENGLPLVPDESGCILSCRALCPKEGGEIEVMYSEEELVFSVKRGSYSGEVSMALDLGTTTLAMSFVSSSGDRLASLSLLNPQRAFGGDVITRIDKSREHLKELQSCVLRAVKDGAEAFCSAFPEARLKNLTVAGNPTMLHIVCGISPEEMGVYPFTPVFLGTKRLTGSELDLPFEAVTLLPSASAFIGSDVICGGLICNMRELDEPSMLIDLGTNGEMILCTGRKNNSRLLCTSAAAGPALEGASISCGVGGVSGGISRVSQSGVGHVFSTVNDKEPVGICGSGLIDLIACLLDDETVDETGYMEAELTLSGIHKTASGLSDIKQTPIRLTQRDVREFQLAKSAVRAGIDILLDLAELLPSDISRVFIAGGLGCYTDPVSAVRTGLLPKEFLSRTEAVGNTSLQGALRCLNEQDLKKAEELARDCETVSLNESPRFTALFSEYMMFE